MRVAVVTDERRLVLRIQYLDDQGVVQTSEDRELAANIREVRFAYAVLDSGAGTIWQNTWVADNVELPLAVRIRAAEDATPPWPEFTVRLLYAAPP